MTSQEILLQRSKACTPVNTHCHHLPDERQAGHDLDFSLSVSYVGWTMVPKGKDETSRKSYLEQVRHKSYFVWLERALQEIYGFHERISAQNWDSISELIRKANDNPGWHLSLLTGACRYSSIILDCYWKPGDDNTHPEIFRPTLRIDPYLRAYAPFVKDRDGTSFADLHPGSCPTLESLAKHMKKTILSNKSVGVVAIKSAIAYERNLIFARATDEEARIALEKGENADGKEIDAFQSWMFFTACRIAGETDTPFQIHTGLGALRDSRAIHLANVIEGNPGTKFVLFHGSYPWSDDICALVHNYRNVYADLCWLPLISPVRARTFIKEMVELGTTDRMTWGCDTWTGEESYGALLAVQDALSRAFGELVDEHWLTLDDAAVYVEKVLRHNAVTLYGVK